MDRVYKEDIPAMRRALEELKNEFSRLASKTDWTKLRVQPLLEHARSLERLLQSPQFAQETSRLPRGVRMFHADLVYLRENIKSLKAVLAFEKAAQSGRPRAAPRGPARPLRRRN